MPYRVRIIYIDTLSFLLHAPFKLFGAVARLLLDGLNIEPRAKSDVPAAPVSAAPAQGKPAGRAALLYSGGTDSTCAAALFAERFEEVHLLTFYEHATRNSPTPSTNVGRLQKRFPSVQFLHRTISVDGLVRFFWYERYLSLFRKFGYLVLATPGFSSLSWHVRTITYCLEHDITHVADGLTRELMHFPGHMDAVVEIWRELYKHFGITYENPVRDWQTPPDHQFIDQVLVNRHDGEFFLGDRSTAQNKTTGQYLFAQGIFPHPDLKGSRLDFNMQHDCYPFSLYNVLAFWGHLAREPYPVFEEHIRRLMAEKARVARTLLEEHQRGTGDALTLMIK